MKDLFIKTQALPTEPGRFPLLAASRARHAPVYGASNLFRALAQSVGRIARKVPLTVTLVVALNGQLSIDMSINIDMRYHSARSKTIRPMRTGAERSTPRVVLPKSKTGI